MVLDLFCLPYFKALFILVPWIFTANIGNKIPQMLETKNHKSWKQKTTKVGNKKLKTNIINLHKAAENREEQSRFRA